MSAPRIAVYLWGDLKDEDLDDCLWDEINNDHQIPDTEIDDSPEAVDFLDPDPLAPTDPDPLPPQLPVEPQLPTQYISCRGIPISECDVENIQANLRKHKYGILTATQLFLAELKCYKQAYSTMYQVD